MARKKCPVEITWIYGLLTKRHVNMAGYWRSKFSFGVFMGRDMESRFARKE